jgi:type II secretory pathway pseudopilin PulG
MSMKLQKKYVSRNSKNKKGFTIVDAVLSVALIGFAFIGFLTIFQSGVQKIRLTENLLIAINLSRGTHESIAAYKDRAGYAGTITQINTNNAFDESNISGFENFVIDATALKVNPDNDDSVDDFLDADPTSNYARITVQVSWDSGAHSISLVSLIADY